MLRRFVVLAFVAIGSFAAAYPLTPDEDQTTGSLCRTSDRDFEEYRYPERIPYCRRNVSSSLKARIYDSYGIPPRERKEYTIDHLIPLSLGGTNRADNLWPEHREVKALRPNLEYGLYVKLRDGRITQRQAIRMILDAKFDPRWARAPRPPDGVFPPIFP